MSLTGILRGVQERWRTFVQVVWPEGPAELTRAEHDRLAGLIGRRGGRLLELRGRIDRLLDKLGRQLGRLRELSSRLLVHNDEPASAAWARLQQQVGRRRERVERLEQRYEAECAALDRLRMWRRALGLGIPVRWAEGPKE